jgi:hypothetical protein
MGYEDTKGCHRRLILGLLFLRPGIRFETIPDLEVEVCWHGVNHGEQPSTQCQLHRYLQAITRPGFSIQHQSRLDEEVRDLPQIHILVRQDPGQNYAVEHKYFARRYLSQFSCHILIFIQMIFSFDCMQLYYRWIFR